MSESFVHSSYTVELSNGEKVTLPPLTLRRILIVTKSLSKLVKTAQEHLPDIMDNVGKFDEDPVGIGAKVIKALPGLIPLVLDELVEVLSLYVERDKDWILDNMNIEDLVKVVTPFFGLILKESNIVILEINKAFPSKIPVQNN